MHLTAVVSQVTCNTWVRQLEKLCLTKLESLSYFLCRCLKRTSTPLKTVHLWSQDKIITKVVLFESVLYKSDLYKSLHCHWHTHAMQRLSTCISYGNQTISCTRPNCWIQISWWVWSTVVRRPSEVYDTHWWTKWTAPETISRSRDMVGAHQNLNGSRDLTTPLTGMFCHLWASTCYRHRAYQIWSL